jgi:hypothetical protein
MFLASLPPGFPQNPNVLLIRTHPNPFPSVGYRHADGDCNLGGGRVMCVSLSPLPLDRTIIDRTPNYVRNNLARALAMPPHLSVNFPVLPNPNYTYFQHFTMDYLMGRQSASYTRM